MKEFIRRILLAPLWNPLRRFQIWVAYHFSNPNTLTPPSSLINLIGGGGFENIGTQFTEFFIENCDLKPNHKVLDIGCGVGRMAVPLTKYLDQKGSYAGMDISPTAIRWCNRNISSKFPQFQFYHSDIFSNLYNRGGKVDPNSYSFPFKNESFDFVFLTSVFTHMFPSDIDHYLKEIRRVLTKEARFLFTFFVLNEESLSLIQEDRSSIPFQKNGNYYTRYRNNPLWAIGYEEKEIREMLAQNGFILDEPIRFGSWCGRKEFTSFQDILVGRAG